MRNLLLAAGAAIVLAGCGGESAEDTAPAAAAYSPDTYMQAINDIGRLDDRKDDEARKPGELLAFAQLDRGEVVGDYIMGGGYVTRLLALAVGSNGKVYSFQPEEFIDFRPEYADEQDAAVAPYADDQGNPVRVFPVRAPLAEPGWPEPLDTIITINNFHDLYAGPNGEATAQQVASMLFESLKPGGTLVVVDHAAAEGAGIEVAGSLHRMDPELARAALTGAGFVIEEESDLYSRPDDPRDASVFDESISGQTDQFAWRLRKPA